MSVSSEMSGCSLCLSTDAVAESHGVRMCAMCRGESPRIGDIGSIRFLGSGDDVRMWTCRCGVRYACQVGVADFPTVPAGVLARAVAYHHLTHDDVPASMSWAYGDLEADDAYLLPAPIRATRMRWQREWQEEIERRLLEDEPRSSSSVASGRHPVVTPGRWLWLAAQVVGTVRLVVLLAGLVMLASALTTARASYPGALMLGALAVAVVDLVVLRRVHVVVVRRAWWATGGVGSPPLAISVATPEAARADADRVRARQITRTPEIVSVLVQSLVMTVIAWAVVPLVPAEIGASVVGPVPALVLAPLTVVTVVREWDLMTDCWVDVRPGIGAIARLAGQCVLVAAGWLGPLVGVWLGAGLAGVPAADEAYTRLMLALGVPIATAWAVGRLIWSQVRAARP